MLNKDLDSIWHYHNATKHSYGSVRASAHSLDWANYPLPFKIYTDPEPILLPRQWPESGVDAFPAISSAEPSPEKAVVPDLKTLSSVLYHSAGITRHRTYPGGEIYFRAAACTGALYEVDLYLVCGPPLEIEAGLYHFDPKDFAIRKLRAGDYRGVLARATANDPSIVHAPVTIICTGTYWRNAWKYQARTYRHFFWDNGTLLANLLAMTSAFGLPARLVMGFVDEEVNRLLGLDTQREVAISLVALGRQAHAAPQASTGMEPLPFKTIPYSKEEVDYPLMREAHAVTSLETPEEVKPWRGGPLPVRDLEATGRVVDLEPVPDAQLPGDSIEQVILRRGSTRRFARLPIRFQQLSTLLDRSTQGIPADFLELFGARLNDLYLIVNAVEGLPSGAYFLRRDPPQLELLKEGEFRGPAGYLGLEQELPADASVAIFFLADLEAIFERFGSRGYRAAQIEAGILGGKIYLAAYAQRLGATGLTFYDDEVTDLFSPHATGKSAIFLTAVGIPAKRHFAVR